MNSLLNALIVCVFSVHRQTNQMPLNSLVLSQTHRKALFGHADWLYIMNKTDSIEAELLHLRLQTIYAELYAKIVINMQALIHPQARKV